MVIKVKYDIWQSSENDSQIHSSFDITNVKAGQKNFPRFKKIFQQNFSFNFGRWNALICYLTYFSSITLTKSMVFEN